MPDLSYHVLLPLVPLLGAGGVVAATAVVRKAVVHPRTKRPTSCRGGAKGRRQAVDTRCRVNEVAEGGHRRGAKPSDESIPRFPGLVSGRGPRGHFVVYKDITHPTSLFRLSRCLSYPD